jgi:hypothetical protein
LGDFSIFFHLSPPLSPPPLYHLSITKLNQYGGAIMKRFIYKPLDPRHVQLALLIVSVVMFILGSGAPAGGSGVAGG